MSRSRSRSLVLSSALVLAAACSEGGIGASRHAECRAEPDRALHVQAFAACPGRGTRDAPFCRVASALALIKGDECPGVPWVIEAQGTFPEALEFNYDLRDTGPPREPPAVNVTIKGGTFGGDTWALPGTIVHVGSNVTLTLESVRLTNTAEQGVDCYWTGRPASVVRLRNVLIDRVRNAVVTSRYCGLDAERLTVDTAFGGALQVGGEYRLVNSEVKYSAAYSALLSFDNGARGVVDGLRFRNNVTRHSLIDCSQLPRELHRLDVIHRAPLFADETTCRTVDSTLEPLP